MFSVLKKRQLAAVAFQTLQNSTVSVRAFSTPNP